MASYAPFFYCYITALFGTELFVGGVFAVRSRVENSRKLVWLALAYAWSAPLSIFNVIALPGFPPDLPGHTIQAGPAAWIVWHVGWPLLLAGYAFLGDGSGRIARRAIPFVFGAALVVCVLLTVFGANLPHFVDENEAIQPIFLAGIAIAVACDAVVLAALLRGGGRTARDRLVALAIFFAFLETIAQLVSGHRFSPLFLGARALGLAAAIAMLFALISDILNVLRTGFAVRQDRDRQAIDAKRMRFLARSGRVLSETLDIETILAATVAAAVPSRADFALVNLRGADGTLAVRAARHRDAEGETLLQRLVGRSYVRHGADGGSAAVYIERRAILRSDISPEHLATMVVPEHRELFARLGPRSTIIVPVVIGDDIRGTLNVAYADSGRTYDADDLEMFEEFGRRLAGALANAETYEREHRVADRLQRASLPATLPQTPGATIDAIYQAGSAEARIGGDWYDAFALDDGRLVLSIGDVMGSGLEAAATMGAVRQALRGAAEVLHDPIAILDAVDRALGRDQPDRIVTALIGILDPVSGLFRYASAGHPPPFVRRGDGAIEMLDGSGLPLGLRREPRAEPEIAHATLLDDDALLVLYTDGATESGRDVVAGERILLLAIDAGADAERPAAAIRDEVLRASGIAAVADDIAILTVRLLPNLARRRRFTCDVADPLSATALRKAVVAHMHAEGFAEPALFAAELVTGELLGNVARHAPPIAEVALAFSEGAPVLCMSDRGPKRAFSPREVAREAESGRGLYIVSQLVEELAIVPRAGGGSIVRVVLSREATLAPAGESE